MRGDLIPTGRVVRETESFWIAAEDKPIFQVLERREADRDSSAPQTVLARIPDRPFRCYKPLEENGLFLTFADTPPTPEGVLRFANRYGPLGQAARIWIVPDASDYESFVFYPGDNPEQMVRIMSDPEGHSSPMEAIIAWKNEISWMRHLTQIWLAAQARDWRAIKRYMTWQGEKILHRWEPLEKQYERRNDPRYKGEEVWDDDMLRNSEGGPLFRRGDLAGPAMYFVMRAINMSHSVRAALMWSEDRHRPELTYRANELLGAMYWQFAQALDKGWKYRQCPICRKNFQLAPGENRTDRLTCSSTCRTYLYRQRMAQARQLHQQGQSPPAIAKKLNTTEATVQKWIAKEQSS